jgi:hypothetical protein
MLNTVFVPDSRAHHEIKHFLAGQIDAPLEAQTTFAKSLDSIFCMRHFSTILLLYGPLRHYLDSTLCKLHQPPSIPFVRHINRSWTRQGVGAGRIYQSCWPELPYLTISLHESGLADKFDGLTWEPSFAVLDSSCGPSADLKPGQECGMNSA